MSRSQRIFAAVGSGYVAQIANIIGTGISIPLALHYLNPSQFGLWAVVGQVTSYLALADLGFGGSVARVLIDHKDDMRGGTYGAILKATLIIFSLLAGLIVLFGFLVGPLLVHLLRVDPALSGGFKSLLIMQCTILAISMLTQPFGLPLWSHQRLDVINYTNVGTHMISVVALWVTLKLGCSYYSLGFAALAGMSFYSIVATTWALRLRLVPHPRYWGRLTPALFWEVAHLSRDLFVLSVATQLTSATQVLLVSNLLGLGAAGVWTVCTKAFAAAQTIIARILDFSAPAFSEMVVRNETSRLKHRLSNVVALSAVGAGMFAVLGASGNRDLIYLWTRGKVTWDFASDLSGAACLFLFCVTRCYTSMTAVTKQIGAYKYFALGEGVIVVLGGLLLGKKMGFTGIFVASIVANLLCNMLYGVRLVSRYFRTDWQEVSWGWLHRSFAFIAAYGACCAGLFSLPNATHGARFFVTSGIAGIIGVPLAWFLGLDLTLRSELRSRLTKIVGLERFLPVEPVRR